MTQRASTETARQGASKAVDSPKSIAEVEGDFRARDYPLDSLSIRSDLRTLREVIRQVRKGFYIMDFPEDLVWDEQRQSRLIESVLMRIPLPIFYLSENPDGKQVVMDGRQRLTTFQRFFENKLPLHLERDELRGKTFDELPPKLQNRFEDTMLTVHIVDAKVPDYVKLDIITRITGVYQGPRADARAGHT